MGSIEWWYCPWPWVPPNHPKPPQFSAFCTAIYIFVTDFITVNVNEPRDFKFDTLIYHSKSHPADVKFSLKEACSGSGDPFLVFYTPCNISATANARDFKFCTRSATWSLTGDIHNSFVVDLFMTPKGQWKRLGRVMVECTCLLHIASN